MPLKHGIPSHDTLERLFKHLDAYTFSKQFIKWASCLVQHDNGRMISIDGKTLRGFLDSAENIMPSTW